MALRVSDLSVDELRELLHEVVEEVLEEKFGMTTDPDAGLELRPEMAESLSRYLDSDRRGDDTDDVLLAFLTEEARGETDEEGN